MGNEPAVASKSLFTKLHISYLGNPLLISFSAIILMITLGDAIVSYIAPGFIQSQLNNSGTLMGLIIAISSIVGAVSDFFISKWFKRSKFGFFLRLTFIFSFGFPLCFLLFPASVPIFIVAMIFWGIYYELIGFASSQFIVEYTKKDNNALAWGIILAFKSLGYTVGPLIAQLLVNKSDTLPFIVAVVFILIGLFGFGTLQKSKKIHPEPKIEKDMPKLSFKNELKIWKVLIIGLWHVLLFTFVLSLIDSTFWTTGTVLSEQLTNKGAPAGILLVLYVVPSLFVGVFAGKISKAIGKKRAAFITALISSILLILAGLSDNVTILLVLIFLSSIFISISWPEISGAFSDYGQRLDGSRNDLIGVSGLTTNIAYIIGPVITGVLSDYIGAQKTFSVIGAITLVISLLMLFVVPKKIRLPQHDIAVLEGRVSDITAKA